MVIRPLNGAEEKGTGLAYGRPPLLSYPKTNYTSTKGTSEIETPKSPPPQIICYFILKSVVAEVRILLDCLSLIYGLVLFLS